MRILIVSDYSTPTGGAELLFERLAFGLRARGHEVRTFSSRAASPGTRPSADYGCRGTLGPLRTPLQTHNRSARSELARAVSDFQPDIAHVGIFLTQLSPLILDALIDVPTVYHAHWYRAVCPTGTKHLPSGETCQSPWGRACLKSGCLSRRAWVLLMAQRNAWRARSWVVDAFVAPSRCVATRLEEAGLGPVTVIPNGVPSAGGEAADRTEPADGTGPMLFGYAGRLERQKGPLLLIDVFAAVLAEEPSARLIMIGDGPARAAVEARLSELALDDRVHLTGWCPRQEVERLLSAVTVQAVPSQWEEPFGLVAAEALMRGTPVVVSDSGGLREIVRHDETGLRVAPSDVGAWAEALLSLARDGERRARFRSAGRRDAETRFSEDLWLDRIARLYDTLVTA